VGEAGRHGGQRRSIMTAATVKALVGWHCGAATQRAGVQRCACIGPPPRLRVHLSSPLRLSVHAYSERERRAGGWGGGAEPTLSRLVVPIKDVSERCTSLEIVYAAWHTCARQCGDVMYVCHLIRRTDWDNADVGR